MPVRGKRPRRAPGAAGDINTHYAQVIHYTPHTRILGVESTPGVMYNRNRNTTPNTAQEKKTNVQSTKRFYPKRRDDAERLENQQRPRHYNRVVGVPYISNRCDAVIWESIRYAIEDRKQYENITEFAEFISEHYI